MDSFGTKSRIFVNDNQYIIYNIKNLEKQYPHISKMPYSLKIILENMLRHEDGIYVTKEDILNFINYDTSDNNLKEIAYFPERVIMQDFTGVPAVVDIASLRNAMHDLGKNPANVDLAVPVDLIIDHSVQVDKYGTIRAINYNLGLEYKRNLERYKLLKWASKSFKNFRVFAPNSGIVHQVNLEYLGEVVKTKEINGEITAYCDTLIGTDSHTTMINGLSILGWGVGGIEAEAVILGEPYYMKIPKVVGVRLSGQLKEGSTTTDLVLSITNFLRKYDVVDKFVEYFGPGLKKLSVPDRATISNMSPEYGSTVGFFPIDDQTLEYLDLTNRGNLIELVSTFAKQLGLFYDDTSETHYSQVIDFDLSSVEPTLAGPSRPQDKIVLRDTRRNFYKLLNHDTSSNLDLKADLTFADESGNDLKIGETRIYNGKKIVKIEFENEEFLLSDGSIVIAAITSCTNTSNPSAMIGAGLIAKKAVEYGLSIKPYIKTSLAPGSKVVDEYLKKSNLLAYLEALRFHIVAHGCTTCIGNSGPLNLAIENIIKKENLIVASVLSGNRNFEARIHNSVRANYLASPMLVVAFAIAGRVDIDLTIDPLGLDVNGNKVFLKDIWPTNKEINDVVSQCLDKSMFYNNYQSIFDDRIWDNLKINDDVLYEWEDESTYIKKAPYFDKFDLEVKPLKDIENARVLLTLKDSITTDHISPAGRIPRDYPAGKYLIYNGVDEENFNTYGSRRGNHEVMVRGTFGNVRLKNNLVLSKEGPYTIKLPEKHLEFIYDAAVQYKEENVPLIILAGKEYGSGSSRDWAAKGTKLLGIKAIIAKSFERIHRSNLIDMGVLPLQFMDDQDYEALKLDGTEEFFINIEDGLEPLKILKILAKSINKHVEFNVICRLDTKMEVEYYKNDGILNFVLRKLAKQN